MKSEAHAGVFYAHWSTGGGLEIGGTREFHIARGNLADFFEVVRLLQQDKHAENTSYRLERTAAAGLRIHRGLALSSPLYRFVEFEDDEEDLDDEDPCVLLYVSPLDVSDFLDVINQMMPQPMKDASP